MFKDRSNPLEDLDEDDVFERYRFRPLTIVYIVGLLPDLSCATNRNQPLPPLLQVLLCLRYFATGAMHLLVGDSLNISRSSAGRCIRTIARHIANLARQFVVFPTGIDAASTKRDFSSIAGFPNVLGCVDGTQIKIIKPRQHEADYVNRKGYHSLNVQVCCDPKFLITSCVAHWPGSVHDSRIFRQSTLCTQFENGQHDGILLGDSGYPCKRFLMTPFLNPATAAEQRFNDSLCRTRVLVEQTFGVLKRRFQCLHHEMATSPPQAAMYVVACVVLHNIGIKRGDILSNDDGVLPPIDDDGVRFVGRNDGVLMRQHIVNNFF